VQFLSDSFSAGSLSSFPRLKEIRLFGTYSLTYEPFMDLDSRNKGGRWADSENLSRANLGQKPQVVASELTFALDTPVVQSYF
jgi:hypothetical protein